MPFDRNLLLIVGAGASKEFGLPVGSELKKQISELTSFEFSLNPSRPSSGDDLLYSTFEWIAEEMPELPNDIMFNKHFLLGAALRFNSALPLAPSIDNFIDTNRGEAVVSLIGKLAIARAISQAEQESKLLVPDEYLPNFISGQISDSWLGQLFHILVSGRDFEQFLSALRKITFVSFNYDRCIHQFFKISTDLFFGLDSDQSALDAVGDAIEVIYPYGSIGNFDWFGLGFRSFGAIESSKGLFEASQRIRTFTEGSTSKFQSQVLRKISRSTIVLFLGFGFLPLNMRALFEGAEVEASWILATTLGLPSESPGLIQSELKGVFRASIDGTTKSHLSDGQVQLIPSTCAELIWNHSRRLHRWLE